MNTPANEHETAVRATARADVDTLGARRPRFEDAAEVHCDRSDDEPASGFEIALAELGPSEVQRIYEDEWDRALAERDTGHAPVDRSMLPSSSAEQRAAGTVGAAWTLTWIPRVDREHDGYRGKLEQIAEVMEDSVPHADDGTACAVIAYDAIGDALEVQIGLVVAALAREGKRPTTAAVEAAREAAAVLGQHMAAAIGCGLNGSAIRDHAQAFADRLAELHRSGIQ